MVAKYARQNFRDLDASLTLVGKDKAIASIAHPMLVESAAQHRNDKDRVPRFLWFWCVRCGFARRSARRAVRSPCNFPIASHGSRTRAIRRRPLPSQRFGLVREASGASRRFRSGLASRTASSRRAQVKMPDISAFTCMSVVRDRFGASSEMLSKATRQVPPLGEFGQPRKAAQRAAASTEVRIVD